VSDYSVGGRIAGKVALLAELRARALETACVRAVEQLCGVTVTEGDGWWSVAVDPDVPLGQIQERRA
jgi:hypothetical protein